MKRAAKGATNVAPPIVATNVAPPIVATNVAPPIVATNVAPPIVATNVAPPIVATNVAPPIVATNVAPPIVATSIVATIVTLLIHGPAYAVLTQYNYQYSRQVLGQLTEGCIAQTQGGAFVGVGPALAYPPAGGTRSILFVSGGGTVRTVATGLNSIGDCVYDPNADVLYVTDSGLEFSGATTGDTVFAIPGDSTNLPVAGHEVLPSGSIPAAFSIDLLDGDLLVSDATGGGNGRVIRIDLADDPPSATTFASGFDYTGGITVNGSHVLISQAVSPSFESVIYSYSDGGAYESTLHGPSYDHGSIDVDINYEGEPMMTGSPTLAVIDDFDGMVRPMVTGINGGGASDAFGGGLNVNDFTGRIDFLASTFTGADDDKSIHRLVNVDRLVEGGGNPSTDCAMEIYGLQLAPTASGKPSHTAICTDGDACDADGQADGTCTFPIGVCLNVQDYRLNGECAPTGVAAVQLLAVSPESDEMQALVNAVSAAVPAADGACFFSDGMKVALGMTSSGEPRRGRGVLRLRAVMNGEHSRKDTDTIKLVCEPAP